MIFVGAMHALLRWKCECYERTCEAKLNRWWCYVARVMWLALKIVGAQDDLNVSSVKQSLDEAEA